MLDVVQVYKVTRTHLYNYHLDITIVYGMPMDLSIIVPFRKKNAISGRSLQTHLTELITCISGIVIAMVLNIFPQTWIFDCVF